MKKNQMNPTMKNLQNIENKYGIFLLRMALTHLIGVGVNNLTEENVIESIEKIVAQGRKDKENGKIQIMSPVFQCEIIRCAAALSKNSIWDLVTYIKVYVAVG